MTFDLGSFLGGLVAAMAAAGGLFYAAQQLKLTADQHKASEIWRKAEFARSLVDRLGSDDELAFCARALDWGIGPLIIPAKYRPLFLNDETIISHDPDLMLLALQPGLDFDPANTTPLLYRYCFDSLLAYLEMIRHYTSQGMIERQSLVGLDYYLKLIASPPYVQTQSSQLPSPFLPFIRRYYPSLEDFIWTKK